MAQNITFDVIARDKASSTFSRISRSSDSTAGRLAKFGKKASLALGGLGFAAGAVVKNSISLEASFSKTMAQVAASTGAPQAALGKMNELAMKLGAQTKFSANEAAGAMLELAKAGIATKDIMGGALSGTLLLAAAGDTDLATAATIASNAMNTFNLRGKDMNSIASALAGGANASSASVESLGQALQQVGPGALNAGLSLQETVAALSAFDAAGIKGSDAGTSLKTMLARLVPQTDKATKAMEQLGLDFVKGNGEFESLANIAEQLRTRLGPLSAAQRTVALSTIFGSDATRAATVLMKQGSAGIETFIRKTKDQTAATKMANANMSGTAGALERLKGSIETAQLALGKALAPTIQKTADFLSEEAVPALTKFIKGMQDGTGAGGDMAAGIKTLASAAKSAVKFINDLPGPVKKYGAELLIAAVAMRKLTAVTSGWGASLTSPIARTKQFAAEMTYTATRTQALKGGLQSLQAGLRTAAGPAGMVLLADGATKAGTKLGTLETAAGGALSGAALGAFAGPVGAAIGAGIGGLAGAAFSLTRNTRNAADAAMEALTQFGNYAATLDQVTGATTAATRAMATQKLEESGVLAATRAAGLADRQVVNALLKGGPARERVIAALRRERTELDAMVTAKKAEVEATTKASLRRAQDMTLTAEARNRAVKAMITAKEELEALKDLRSERDKQIASTLKSIGVVDKDVAAARRRIAANKDYGTSLNALPKVKRTKVEAVGIVPTTQGIAKVARQIDATPKELKTLIRAAGVQTTVADVQRVMTKMAKADKLRARPKIELRGLSGFFADVQSAAQRLNDLSSGPGPSKRAGPQGRAMGGPVFAGTPYIVGERRPELFVPNRSGRIIPDLSRVPGAGSSGGGDQVIEIHMHLEGETIVKQIRLRNKKRGVVTAAI